MNNKIKYATILALATAIISGFNSFLAKIAVTAVKDPVVFTSLKNGIVGLFLIGAIIAWKKWPEIKNLNRKQWLMLVAIGIVGGFIPFALFFTGLAHASAVNASLIHKTLFLWVFIFAIPFLKEKITWPQWIGVGLIFLANLMVGGFNGFKFSGAELMILGATIFWAVENIIAKKALASISTLTVVSARMVIGSLLLFGLVGWQGNIGIIARMSGTQWLWTLIPAVLLTGYVLTWYKALSLAPATYVATLLVPATLITNALSAIFVTHSLSGQNIMGGALYIAGAIIVIYFYGRNTSLHPVRFRA